MDSLSSLFSRFRPSAQTFFSGNLCDTVDFREGAYLHLFKGGMLRLIRDGYQEMALSEPTALFFPRGPIHTFVADPQVGADLVCAHVALGAEVNNPLALGLPECVIVPLAGQPTLARVCNMLWDEAFANGDGKQAALDLLLDYFLILVIRYVIATGDATGAVIAGLGDSRLARALTAIHDEPGRSWTLDDLAETAGMSRARFAAHFKKVVGRPVIDYLGSWRMTVAQDLLAQGTPIQSVASKTGYESPAAFSRAFTKYVGESPRGWLGNHR